jgi:hypothetical protein
MSDLVYIINYVTKDNVTKYYGNTVDFEEAEKMLKAAWKRDDCKLAFIITARN